MVAAAVVETPGTGDTELAEVVAGVAFGKARRRCTKPCSMGGALLVVGVAVGGGLGGGGGGRGGGGYFEG